MNKINENIIPRGVYVYIADIVYDYLEKIGAKDIHVDIMRNTINVSFIFKGILFEPYDSALTIQDNATRFYFSVKATDRKTRPVFLDGKSFEVDPLKAADNIIKKALPDFKIDLDNEILKIKY